MRKKHLTGVVVFAVVFAAYACVNFFRDEWAYRVILAVPYFYLTAMVLLLALGAFFWGGAVVRFFVAGPLPGGVRLGLAAAAVALLFSVGFFRGGQLFSYYVVVPYCERISHYNLTDGKAWMRAELEGAVLKKFSLVENPDKRGVNAATKFFLNDYERRHKPVTVVAYYRFHRYKCFEVVYSEDQELLHVVSDYE
jgi:hypothetical protein